MDEPTRNLPEVDSNPSVCSGRRGSILLLALLFASIAAIALGGYISLASTELQLANTQFYFNAGMNLAEAGAEEAIYALNNDAWDLSTWTDGSIASQKFLTLKGLELGKGAIGEINVRMDHIDSKHPVIFSQGTVISSGGRTTIKQIEIKLRRRTLFGNGLTARDMIRFAGNNVIVDSYSSADGPYHPSRRRYNGTVASASVEAAPDIGNGSVFGFVFTGGKLPDVGPHGEVRGEDPPASGNVDFERVATDFTSEFPPPPPPDSLGESIGRISGSMILESGSYRAPEVDLSSSHILEIRDHVRLNVARGQSGKGDLKVAGNAEIIIREGATLILHVDGDVNIAGNGVVNETNVPANFLLLGNNPTSQDFSLGGNGDWQAAVYAPEARVTIVGNGEMSGAVVGRQIHLGGGAAFHYDETLSDFGNLGYRMENWRELIENSIAFY